MDAFNRSLQLSGCTVLLPGCTEGNQYSEGEAKGSKREVVGERAQQNGDIYMIKLGHRTFPTVAETGCCLLTSILLSE